MFCVSCGAPVEEGWVACQFCGAAQDEGSPSQAEEAVTGGCPRCRRPLETVPVRVARMRIRVDRCPGCRGLQVAEAGLEALLDAATAGDPLSDLPLAEAVPRLPGVLACPACGEPMRLRPWGVRSTVSVDWCGEHGVWLDPGTLQALVERARREPAPPPLPEPVVRVTPVFRSDPEPVEPVPAPSGGGGGCCGLLVLLVLCLGAIGLLTPGSEPEAGAPPAVRAPAPAAVPALPRVAVPGGSLPPPTPIRFTPPVPAPAPAVLWTPPAVPGLDAERQRIQEQNARLLQQQELSRQAIQERNRQLQHYPTVPSYTPPPVPAYRPPTLQPPPLPAPAYPQPAPPAFPGR